MRIGIIKDTKTGREREWSPEPKIDQEKTKKILQTSIINLFKQFCSIVTRDIKKIYNEDRSKLSKLIKELKGAMEGKTTEKPIEAKKIIEKLKPIFLSYTKTVNTAYQLYLKGYKTFKLAITDVLAQVAKLVNQGKYYIEQGFEFAKNILDQVGLGDVLKLLGSIFGVEGETIEKENIETKVKEFLENAEQTMIY